MNLQRIASGIALLFILTTLLGTAKSEEPAPLEPGFKLIFNGKDLSGWRYRKESLEGKVTSTDQRFTAKDGVLVITGSSKAHPGNTEIDTVASFDKDFVLRFDFRAEKDANSGLHLRDHQFKNQLQIRDYLRVGPYKTLKKFNDGGWNAIEVTVKTDASGKAIAHCTCNGEVLEDALPIPAKGAIGLQSETNKLEYRNIRVKSS
jgi:hypothetical protein